MKFWGLGVITTLVVLPLWGILFGNNWFYQLSTEFARPTVQRFVKYAKAGERYPLIHALSNARFDVFKKHLYINNFKDTLPCSKRRNSNTPVPAEHQEFCQKYDQIIEQSKQGLIQLPTFERAYNHIEPILLSEVERQRAREEVLKWIKQKKACLKNISQCGHDERGMLKRVTKLHPHTLRVYEQFLTNLYTKLTFKQATHQVVTQRASKPCYGNGFAPNGLRMAHGMVFIPKDSFIMGSELGRDNEKPVHAVDLRSYWIDQCEVSNEQFLNFLVANPQYRKARYPRLYHDGDYLKNWPDDLTPPENQNHYPVVYVSWFSAQAYCEAYKKRLPTEAEWEYAARGGRATQYHFGDDPADLFSFAWYQKNSDESLHPRGKQTPNPFSLYDMYGNVWEWTADYYAPYPDKRVNNPQGPKEGKYRVIRGGSWKSPANEARSAIRGDDSPYQTHPDVGFRCVAEARPKG